MIVDLGKKVLAMEIKSSTTVRFAWPEAIAPLPFSSSFGRRSKVTNCNLRTGPDLATPRATLSIMNTKLVAMASSEQSIRLFRGHKYMGSAGVSYDRQRML